MTATTTLLAALALSAGADLQTLSGKKVSGDLVGLDRQTVILKSVDGESVRVPLADVLHIDMPPAEPPPKGAHTAVELTDGSLLLCSNVEAKGDKFELTVIPDLKVSVPMTAVFTVLRDAHDPKVRQEWQHFLTKRGRLDMVVVRSDEKLNGLEGTFGAGVGDAIEFTPSATGQKRNIRLARAQGLIFVQKPNPDAPVPLCKVSDAVGNLYVAADTVLNADGLTVTTVSGARFTVPSPKWLAKFDFSKGKLAYLSDLTPTRDGVTLATEDDDLYARFVRYRKDMNLDNQPLKLGGKSYAKGLAMHAGTLLAYDIGGDYKDLRATLGVDDAVETESKAEVVIEGDGRELFRGQVKCKDPPRPVVVDVRGVKDLRVSVRAIGLLDFGAQATLADAKVSK